MTLFDVNGTGLEKVGVWCKILDKGLPFGYQTTSDTSIRRGLGIFSAARHYIVASVLKEFYLTALFREAIIFI